MPGVREVQHYLTGLWLLLWQDPKGFQHLDLSDRGALRSFWSIVYALPAIAISWLWLRRGYLAAMPEGTSADALYFFRLALVEGLNWIVPLVLAGALAWAIGIGSRYSAIVTAVNWLTLPFSYAYAFLILLLMIAPMLSGLVALLWLFLLLALIGVYMRVLQMICDGHLLTAAATTLLLLVPSILLSDIVERFLGVYPG
ncbi:hypothetical protein [Ciceribacter sp. L1K22]|uniref:hypothetical protein n=1 Tax=Ciceribacter sp. L1K22 TaxID=2820275 RepID=UPI001ABE7498|nr:hypothetical protein [Ciceribacter sp. L1K22]MBO3758830.1 hypothetical protein [Ciceribacter sp. L1K22]